METEDQPTFSSVQPKVHSGRLNMAADFKAYAKRCRDEVEGGTESADEEPTAKKKSKGGQVDPPSWAVLGFGLIDDDEKWPMLPKRPGESSTGFLKGCKFLLRAYISWLWGRLWKISVLLLTISFRECDSKQKATLESALRSQKICETYQFSISTSRSLPFRSGAHEEERSHPLLRLLLQLPIR